MAKIYSKWKDTKQIQKKKKMGKYSKVVSFDIHFRDVYFMARK